MLTHSFDSPPAWDAFSKVSIKNLDPEDYETWLTGSSDEAAQLMRPFPAEKMRIVRQGEGVKEDPAG